MTMEYSRALRLLDKYLGSCICFLFSLVHALRRRPQDKTIRKVLVIELFEMGASIMAHSSLRQITRALPDVELYCLCLESTKEPWLLLGDIPRKNVYALDNSSLVAWAFSILKISRALSKENIDLIIDFELFTRASAIIAFLIRAKYRSGFYRYTMEGLYRGTFYDIKCSFNQNMHIVRNLLALTKSAVSLSTKYHNYDGPIPRSDITTASYVSVKTKEAAVREKLRDAYPGFTNQRILIVNPTVGRVLPMRDYPKEQFVKVIQELLVRYPEHLVVLTGTPAHGPVTEYIHQSVNDPRCINFRGQTVTIAEFLELCLIADLLISNDSGPAHFASMTPLKILALYGPESPHMYGPLGNAVCLYKFFHSSPMYHAYDHKNPPENETDSMRVITPDDVVNMVETLLKGKATYLTINNELPYLP